MARLPAWIRSWIGAEVPVFSSTVLQGRKWGVALAGLVVAGTLAIASHGAAGSGAQTAQTAPKNQVALTAEPFRSSWS
jgi:hypothetical protein